MCEVCRGESVEDALSRYQQLMDWFGWALVQVGPGGPSEPTFTHTVGLHRFGGHPELLCAGSGDDVPAKLDALGEQVRAGRRFMAGERLPTCPCHRAELVEVADPRRLVIAQALGRSPEPAAGATSGAPMIATRPRREGAAPPSSAYEVARSCVMICCITG